MIPSRATPAAPVLGWGLLLVLLTALAVLGFDVDLTSPVLLGGAAVATLALGFALALRGAGPAPAVLADPDTSAATVWLAASVALLALSAVAGVWLTLIAGGMTGAGIGGVVRELRAQRAAVDAGGDDGAE